MVRFLSALFGNLTEISHEKLMEEHGRYLVAGETISFGYKLIRDSVIFTDKRIIVVDRQGVTGIRAQYFSIYFDSIYDVSCETAGFGLNDSVIEVFYIQNPNQRGYIPVERTSRKFEFPKSYDIQPLYTMLQQLAFENRERMNT